MWAQFLALCFEAFFPFRIGKVDTAQPWYVALAVLVCFLGGDGGRHYGSVELHADPLLHRLRRRHVRNQSVLVLTDVCPERCRNNQRHCGRLGHSWKWRDPDLYDVGTFQSYGGFRNGAEYRWACLDGGASGHVSDLFHLHKAHVLGYAYGTQPRSGRDRQYTKAFDVGLCRRAAGRSRCGHDLSMLCVV